MVVLGFIMIAGQIMGIVKVFGGGNNRPKWLNIVVGILCCLFFVGAMGLAME